MQQCVLFSQPSVILHCVGMSSFTPDWQKEVELCCHDNDAGALQDHLLQRVGSERQLKSGLKELKHHDYENELFLVSHKGITHYCGHSST